MISAPNLLCPLPKDPLCGYSTAGDPSLPNAGFERGASSETGGARTVPTRRGWSVDARSSRWKSGTEVSD